MASAVVEADAFDAHPFVRLVRATVARDEALVAHLLADPNAALNAALGAFYAAALALVLAAHLAFAAAGAPLVALTLPLLLALAGQQQRHPLPHGLRCAICLCPHHHDSNSLVVRLSGKGSQIVLAHEYCHYPPLRVLVPAIAAAVWTAASSSWA